MSKIEEVPWEFVEDTPAAPPTLPFYEFGADVARMVGGRWGDVEGAARATRLCNIIVSVIFVSAKAME